MESTEIGGKLTNDTTGNPEWTLGRINYLTNCVFVDETSFNLHLHRTGGRSRQGEPARSIVPVTSRGRNFAIFSAISHRGVQLMATHVNI
jgi:hypothetical protein